MPSTHTLCDEDLSLATDLYQITMAAVYHRRHPQPRGTFELFVRRLPEHRSFLVFAGLEQALASLARFTFDREQVEYLRSLPPFRDFADESFFHALEQFRFLGEVWAMPEGSLFFPDEPVLRVTGTLVEAQLVETLLLSIVNFQTMVASKAARIRLAAGDGIDLAEFGSRRAHGPQAGAWVARAAYLGGFDSTSNVLAGQRLGIPVVGTMAHSFVMSYDDERRAFADYREAFPDHTILLVDTYDTIEGVRRALELGEPFAGVRLDSGDLLELSRETRRILDEAGREDARIFASGDMDEHRIAEMVAAGAPVDAYGVGTQLATSADSPYVPGIYKLVQIEVEGETKHTFKASSGKATYPGPKQVIRRVVDGRARGDRVVAAAEAAGEEGEPLLRCVVRDGELLASPSLEAARERRRAEIARLPEELRALEPPAEPYPVEISERLREELEAGMEEIGVEPERVRS